MKTECPHCNQHYEVDDQYNGQVVECQKCKQEFFVEPLRELPPKRKSEPSKAVAKVAVPKAKPASKQCPFCKAEIAGDAQKCCHCGEWVVEKISVEKQISNNPKTTSSCTKISRKEIVALIIFAIAGAIFWLFLCLQFNNGWRAEAPGMFFSGIVFLAIILTVSVVARLKIGKKNEEFIICPNPNCRYQGAGKQSGTTSGCLLVVLLCLGILPGILYLLFVGKPGIICPRCGMRVR